MVAQKNLMKKAIHYTIIAIFNSILNPTFYNWGKKEGRGGESKVYSRHKFHVYSSKSIFISQEIMEHKLKQQMA